MANDADITPAILLQHMQAMRADFSMQIQAMERRIMQKFDEINVRLDKLEHKVDLLFVQIDNIDKRLDDIEIELLPKRVAVLEVAVGIGGKAGR